MTTGERLFDMVVVVDWSASARPTIGRDSIWVTALDVTTGRSELVNHRTRHDAEMALRRQLREASGRRVLVGVDFALGYPAGFAAILAASADVAPVADADGGAGADWRTVWRYLRDQISDDVRNRNNRFEVAARMNALFVDRHGAAPGGPFWGCPATKASARLHTHKAHSFPIEGAAGEIAELRLAERSIREAGHRPFSVWQTAYAGSVGGQTLVGIPVVDRLVNDPDVAPRALVWPFDTGLVADPTAGRDDAVVFAEVWPSLIELDAARHEVRDAAQVLGMCDRLAALDRTGDLAPEFAPLLTDVEAALVVSEEGWILGA